MALKEFAAGEKLPYADQFHALVDLWGKNKPQELLANALVVVKPLAQDDSLVGVEHLRAFLAAQEKSPTKPVSMQGDPVHPGPPGQLMMAAALLKELGADGFVSSVTIDASGKLSEAKGCEVDQIKAEGGKLEFDRLDERLPLPVPDEARAVLPLYPAILELSQYMLRVTGLTSGTYALKINGIATATLTAKELEAGVNLTALGVPSQGQGRRSHCRPIASHPCGRSRQGSRGQPVAQPVAKSPRRGRGCRVEGATRGPDHEGGRSGREDPRSGAPAEAALRTVAGSVRPQEEPDSVSG